MRFSALRYKTIRFTGISLLLFLISQISLAQNPDSLWKVYKDKSQADTIHIKTINALAVLYKSSNPDTAIILATEAEKLAHKLNLPNQEANAQNIIGSSYKTKSSYPKALEYFLKALKNFEKAGNSDRVGSCYRNIGNVFYFQHNYSKALEYYFKQLSICEKTGNKQDIGECCGNIGNIYWEQSNISKALEYYLIGLKTAEAAGDKNVMAAFLSNIGDLYGRGESNYSKALEYLFKALSLRREMNDKQGVGICYGNISHVYDQMKNYKLAINYSDSELVISNELGDIEGEREAYENLALVYNKTGRYKEAYENHVKFKQLTDSIFNEENSQQLGDMKTQFEVEKKEAELKVKAEAEQEKLKAIASEENKRQNVIIYAVAGVLLLVVVFSLFLLNRFRITNRQKVIIEKQKQLVDKAYESLHEKNKEVMDSINYASRIQRALLPSQKYIANNLSRLRKK